MAYPSATGSQRPAFPPTFQQGYFTYPTTSSTHIPTTGNLSGGYSVPVDEDRIVNPKKKSDFLVRTWHDEHLQFKSPAELKIKLIDAFPNEVSTNSNFQVGYFEPPANTKRWIMDKRDLLVMYHTFNSGSKINLWCEGRAASIGEEEMPKRKKKKVAESEQFGEETDDADKEDVFQALKKKHPLIEGPKLRLWAKLIRDGRYDDYDSPPSIPLLQDGFTKPKKESLKDVVAGAATAIAKVLQPINLNSPTNTNDENTKISPMQVASVRRSCLEDLRRVKDLYADGILSETEFMSEKEQILKVLKDINK